MSIYLWNRDTDAVCSCVGCDWTGLVSSTMIIEHLEDIKKILKPGNVVPAGKCPECSALCHLDTPVEKRVILVGSWTPADVCELMPRWTAEEAEAWLMEHTEELQYQLTQLGKNQVRIRLVQDGFRPAGD